MGVERTMPEDGIRRYASIDGDYRYWLERQWGDFNPWLTFIMLNPSTADGTVDDPTIRRCMGFAKREGFGCLHVLNLFAYRATNPADLEDAGASGIDVVGIGNPALLDDVVGVRFPIICAWGAHPIAVDEGRKFVDRALVAGKQLHCLGMTKSGAPRHPLYVKGDQPLVPYL